jgi:hypothetical protein
MDAAVEYAPCTPGINYHFSVLTVFDRSYRYTVNSIARALLKLHDTSAHVVAGLYDPEPPPLTSPPFFCSKCRRSPSYLAKDNALLGSSCRLQSHVIDAADSHWPPARMRREQAALMADVNACLEARHAMYDADCFARHLTISLFEELGGRRRTNDTKLADTR